MKHRRISIRTVLFILLPLAVVLHAQNSPIPAKLAEPAVIAARKAFPADQESRLQFIQGFCQAFLDSWRDGIHAPNTTRGFSSTAAGDGYRAGKAALTDEANAVGVTPADFGYTRKTIEGTYKPGFETAQFVTADGGEKFHTHFGMVNTLPEGKVKVDVWMSPESSWGYGHMNQWKREIILIGVQNQK